MDALLIKVKLEPSCDKKLIEYFQSLPKRRRAEQVRRLLTTAMNIKGTESICMSISPLAQSRSDGAQLDDKALFAKDMASF